MKGISLDSITDEMEKGIQTGLHGIAMSAYDDIVQLANENLETTRQDYIKSLEFQQTGHLYIITIREPGYYYEEGFASFDQKPGLLHGPKSKVSKDGFRYNLVPFGHRKKDTTGMTPGPKKSYYEEINKVISSMHKIVPHEMRDRSGRVVGSIVAQASKDVTGYGAGMIKVSKQYDKAKSSTYLTFRAVSEKSPSNTWIHPGYHGLKAFDVVEKMVDDRIDQIIQVVFGV